MHGSLTSVQPLVFAHGADTQAAAESDADVKALTGNNNEAGAHLSAEGDAVGVEAYGDWGPQSCTSAQQVCSVLTPRICSCIALTPASLSFIHIFLH